MSEHTPNDEPGTPDDTYWTLHAKAVDNHGHVLAALEQLRKKSLEHDNQLSAWALSVIETLLEEFPFGSSEHVRVHNRVVAAINSGIEATGGTPAASTAHAIHAGDLHTDGR